MYLYKYVLFQFCKIEYCCSMTHLYIFFFVLSFLLPYGTGDIYDIHICIIFFFTFFHLLVFSNHIISLCFSGIFLSRSCLFPNIFGSFHHSFTICIVTVWKIKDKFIFDQLDRFAVNINIIYTNGSIRTCSGIYF
jgi:hypothetical protein